MKTLMLLIPKKKIKPKIVDIDNMTPEEEVELTEYEDLKTKYDNAQIVVNKWPVNGQYKDIINQDRSATYIKDGIEYLLATLPEDRIVSLKETYILRNEIGINGKIGLTSDIQGWLQDNKFKVVQEEV